MLSLLLPLVLLFCGPAFAAETHMPKEVASHIPQARVLASARFTFMFWQLYDATLYSAAPGQQLALPFALRLQYLVDLSGRDITNRSIEEIRRAGATNEITLAQWHGQLQAIIPDVKVGDSITGIADAHLATHFYKNGRSLGIIHDPAFTKVFFKIWLGKNSTDQTLRQQLTNINHTGELLCAQNFCN